MCSRKELQFSMILTNDFQHSSTGVLASLVDGATSVFSRVSGVNVMNGQHTPLLVHVKFVGWLHVITTAVPKDRRLGNPRCHTPEVYSGLHKNFQRTADGYCYWLSVI